MTATEELSFDGAGFDGLEFDGVAFDGLAVDQPAHEAPAAAVREHPAPSGVPARRAPAGPMAVGAGSGRVVPAPAGPAPTGGDTPSAVIDRITAELRAGVVAAHRSALDLQAHWQQQTIDRLTASPAMPGRSGPVPAAAAPRPPAEGPAGLLRVVLTAAGGTAPARVEITWTGRTGTAAAAQLRGDLHGPSRRAELLDGGHPVLTVVTGSGPAGSPVAAVAAGYRPEGALEPLALTPADRLDPTALAHLAAGRAGQVFGPRFDQPAPSVPGGPLRAVTEIRPGGPVGVGVLRGPVDLGTDAPDVADALAAAWQAGSVLAVWLGLHLVLPDPATAPDGTATVELDGVPDGDAELVAEIADAGLVPRPWLRLDADLRAGGRTLARVRGLTLTVHEPAGTPTGTRRGGLAPQVTARRGITGAPAVVDELVLATASVGDLVPALGPEFARYAEVRATRPPAGGLRLVGRVMEVHGTRGDLSGGAVGVTEYDSAADAWYYGAAPHPSVPTVILMETSLQSALLLGYHLGATLVDPDLDYCLRNLDGAATLHREVDLRGRTVHQRSTLLTTTVLTGAVLQSLSYELWLDGEDPDAVGPFYSGQSLFGFFTATALANQTGLDNGASVPTWLEQYPEAGVRTVAVDTGASGPLHLIDAVEIVDGGGSHGAGYLRAVRPVDPGDWFFARHFHLDPVMPGSLGVEAAVQALQAWLLDTGVADGLTDPEFVVPAGAELTWRYRGQILAGDGAMTLEVHVRSVERRPGRVRVVADASVFKPGLRIYELIGIATEIREKGAPAW